MKEHKIKSQLIEQLDKIMEESSNLCIKDIFIDSDPYKDVFIIENVNGSRYKLYINLLDKCSIENIKLALNGRKKIEAIEEISYE